MTSTTAPSGAPAGPSTGPLTGEVPLVALLGQAESVYEHEFARRVADGGFPALSLAHSRNVLRHLADGPLRASQLVGRCGVSKQALSQQVAQLERAGLLEITPDPHDQRARVLTLTTEGRRAQCLVVRVFAEVEADWARTLGHEDAATLRRALVAVLARAGLEPSCTPTC